MQHTLKVKTFADQLNELIDQEVKVTWVTGIGGGSFIIQAVYDDYVTVKHPSTPTTYHVPFSSILNIGVEA